MQGGCCCFIVRHCESRVCTNITSTLWPGSLTNCCTHYSKFSATDHSVVSHCMLGNLRCPTTFTSFPEDVLDILDEPVCILGVRSPVRVHVCACVYVCMCVRDFLKTQGQQRYFCLPARTCECLCKHFRADVLMSLVHAIARERL